MNRSIATAGIESQTLPTLFSAVKVLVYVALVSTTALIVAISPFDASPD